MTVAAHAALCSCTDCVEHRDRIRDVAIARGQRIGWNAHSLDDPRERNPLTFKGTKPRYVHDMRENLDDHWGTT